MSIAVDLVDCEKGGEHFDPENIDSAKKTIGALLRNRSPEMGLYNYERVKIYDSTQIIRQMQEIYYQTQNDE